MTIRDWLENIGFAFSCLLNSLLFGRPGESLSARIGWDILDGGFWARLPLPEWLRWHFIRAAERGSP